MNKIKKAIKECYLLEDKRIQRELVIQFQNKISDSYFQFLLYNLFPECIQPQQNFIFGIYYYKSKNLIKYLIRKAFDIELETCPEGPKIQPTLQLLEFLLLIEKGYPEISEQDPKFFTNFLNFIISNYSDSLNQILKYKKISSILLLLLNEMSELPESIPPITQDFYYLIKAQKTNNMEMARLIDVNRMSNYLLNEPNIKIREFYILLTKFYPEKLTFVGHISENRMVFLENPLLIKGDWKTIRTYSNAAIIYYKNKTCPIDVHTELYYTNLEILLKLILIEREMAKKDRKDFYKHILHPFFIENPVIIKILIIRRFPIDLIQEITDNVPSFYLGYHIALKLLRNDVNSLFYQTLTESLLRKYPLESNIIKFKSIAPLLPEYYKIKMKEFI
ncbi:hypothetical protein TCON_1982 [Astathelohania contejeani]|uniref:Uncharacterized protein n=1 Tax=Astathelohania contejeani TaxID=164912 RepID=A0ABQ7HX96_9MICR|nr:hypothetical protein TCON_1982 [Thelohania contejeani]